jgi:hypothetical protein
MRVSESSSPLERLSPQDGDVVVMREEHSRAQYTVRQLPGLVQFSTAVPDEAIRLARGFGQKYRVDAWYGEAGTYRLLEACRPRTSAPAAPRQADGLAPRD